MREINDRNPIMGKRLSRIATRTGDDGTTGLGDGSRTGKDDPRVEALGTIDELNAAIGLLLTEPLPPAMATALVEIQHDLFELGGELCIPGYENLESARIEWLDAMLAEFNAELASLDEFILPGGSRAAALAHQARTIARRAERSVVALSRQAAVRHEPRAYLNRLSDLLFVLARTANRAAGRDDMMWNRQRGAGSGKAKGSD
ncbi:MAG TPA: cob(I)yrinic acid a,c-diamide adenosyltransferase [Geminicoccaceae bacterium]|nr:cob(I)yrinic acid a,c-diamide adenosyltransferase [Geminicoccaceae bacterium]